MLAVKVPSTLAELAQKYQPIPHRNFVYKKDEFESEATAVQSQSAADNKKPQESVDKIKTKKSSKLKKIDVEDGDDMVR